ncbi:MAG: hypothetical protein ACO22W_07175 [Steroidobacteraceae bacterium]
MEFGALGHSRHGRGLIDTPPQFDSGETWFAKIEAPAMLGL